MTGRDGITAHALDHDAAASRSWRATAGARARRRAPDRRLAVDPPSRDARRPAGDPRDPGRPRQRRTHRARRHRRPVRPPHRRPPPRARHGHRRRRRRLRRGRRRGGRRPPCGPVRRSRPPRPGDRAAAARRRCSTGTDRRTTYASDDPRALPIYARAGMAPRWVSLYLDGVTSAIEAQPAMEVLQAEPAGSPSSSATGRARSARRITPSGRRQARRRSVRGPRRRRARSRRATDGPGRRPTIACPRSPRPPARTRTRSRRPRGPPSRGPWRWRPGGRPGTQPASSQALLERGFQVVDRDQYMASADDLVDPLHVLPNPGML